MKLLNSMLKNWKTTAAGTSAVLIALGSLGGALKLLASGDVSGAFEAVMTNKAMLVAGLAGLGLMFSRDANKTSEESGIKEEKK